MKFYGIQKTMLMATVIILTAFAANAQSCPPLTAGCLDNSFGVGGWASTFIAGTRFYPRGIAVQSDGRFVVVGRVYDISPTDVIVRYNADGSLDSDFGVGGITYLFWRDVNDVRGLTNSIALQTIGSEERIVVAGWGPGSDSILRVERYLSNGNPDTSFGSGGTVDLPGRGIPLGVAIQPDGKMVSVTYLSSNAGFLVRLNSDGSLDNSFGSGGVVSLSVATNTPRSIALQPNGRILVGGFTTNIRGKYLMAVSRFNTNGTPDGGKTDSTKADSFGKNGTATVEFQSSAKVEAVTVDDGGKILVTGASNGNFSLARLTTAGSLDTAFSSAGKVIVDLGGTDDVPASVAVQSNGKILLTGRGGASPADSFIGLVRFNPNGTLDSTFGLNGKITSDFSNEEEFGYWGSIQVDPVCSCQKLVVTGAGDFNSVRFAVSARYLL